MTVELPAVTSGYEADFLDQSLTAKPLVIELRQTERRANGTFRPAAFLKLAPSFRASGLLLALPAEDLKNLLFLLTFLSNNGDCRATAPQLAAAMHISVTKTRQRLAQLLAFRWQGKPLILEITTESGLIFYTPHPALIYYEQTQELLPEESQPAPYKAAPREAVIAYSREHYARPRAEVERQIAQQMGWDPPEEHAPEAPNLTESPAEKTDKESTGNHLPEQMSREQLASKISDHNRSLRRRLENAGLTTEQSLRLLDSHSRERIERQLHWLPYRHARHPAGYLLAAIEHDYDAPRELRNKAQTALTDTTEFTEIPEGATPSNFIPEDRSSNDLA